MGPPILTHSQSIYLTAVVVLLVVGSASLAQKIWDILRPYWSLSIVGIHLFITSVICLVAAYLWGLPRIIPASGVLLVVWFGAGLICGAIAVRADRAILKIMVPVHNIRSPLRLSLRALAISSSVGVVEEVLFRGYLVDLSLAIPNHALAWSAVVLTTLAFAVSHVYAGVEQVVAKLPLSVLALTSVLGSHTLLCAIVAHVFFNVRSTDTSILDSRQHYW
jgi:hypothetical protein